MCFCFLSPLDSFLCFLLTPYIFCFVLQPCGRLTEEEIEAKCNALRIKLLESGVGSDAGSSYVSFLNLWTIFQNLPSAMSFHMKFKSFCHAVCIHLLLLSPSLRLLLRRACTMTRTRMLHQTVGLALAISGKGRRERAPACGVGPERQPRRGRGV